MTENTHTRLNDGAGLEIAHPEDFGISRDADEAVIPIAQRIPGMEKAVMVKPLVDGEYEEWKDILESEEADDERVDEFLETFITEGIGSDGTTNVPDYVVPGLVQAVKNSSGHEVFRAVEEQQVRENMRQMEAMEGIGAQEMVRDLVQEQMTSRHNGQDGEPNPETETEPR